MRAAQPQAEASDLERDAESPGKHADQGQEACSIDAAPSIKDSDLESQAADLVSEILADVDRANTRRHGIAVATKTAMDALASVRRTAHEAGYEAAVKALRAGHHCDLRVPCMAHAYADHLAANKPRQP